MPARNLRPRVLTSKGKTSAGRAVVRFRNLQGKFRNAIVIDAGSAIAAPTGLGFTITGGAGAFAAGTYFWKVTAVTPSGETVGSNEVTTAVSNNDRVNLSWSARVDATGYKIYRGTATNTEDRLLGTVGQGVTTFQDTGAAGTANAIPVSDTSGGGLKLLLPTKSTINNVPSGTGANTYQAR